MAKKWVYLFAEGNGTMRDLLGGKGAGVAEMTNAGLPVPPGFTITTEACREYYANDKQFPAGMWEQSLEALKKVEQQTGKKFGDAKNPLLVSVRSGAKFSMPGMMDTVLNLGLTPDTLPGMIQLTNNPRFGYDAYRRFIQMFGKIVMGIDAEKFEHALQAKKEAKGVKLDTELTAGDLKEVGEEFKKIFKAETGREFPTDPYEQLRLAINAVFASWGGKRAVDYRNFSKIPHDLGTAVNVQTMVFGNMGSDSGTGVAFTRNPSTGENLLYGEYLTNAQGEDVVAGTRTPQKIAHLHDEMPAVFDQFKANAERMEKHYRDVQDLEFTIERGKLYMLQTRGGKRTAQAAVKIAVDMVNEGLISKEEAVMRVEPVQIEQLLHRRIDPSAKLQVIAKGLNASPGAATGKAIFDPDTAESLAKQGEKVILVRTETSPDDVHGMLGAQGILTARGGATSHAAVVARGLGKPCVSGCESLKIDYENGQFTTGGATVKEGDLISINGSSGEVILGAVPMIEPEMGAELKALLGFADGIRKLGTWANADYPRDARKAREYGAEGIGLCRTEHMFFEAERLPIVQRMILSDDPRVRKESLDKLLPIQKEDFKGIFRAMDGYPVIIRLIDPPLHEFLPSYEELLVEVALLREKGDKPDELAEKEALLKKVAAMREANPMLGLRGIRLGLTRPDITEMQVRAIFGAAIEVTKEGVVAKPEVMIPLTGHFNELRIVRDQLEGVAKEVMDQAGVKIEYKFGTMIEVPRAALTANEIAEYAEFFSFGTNDLTQTTFGYSRDDAEGKFLLEYVQRGILPNNPFQVLDRDGVGELMRIAVTKGKATRPNLEVGICGEHGGDPSSIEFCNSLGLNYVSSSPFRVPIARLAAAQAALTQTERDR
ncbi:MAG: pyruvate, phosphate dikinase [Chloroflexi bacterium]|nr:pyruvate, phosphate dikinase [Chloroflexota bacterium]MCL5110330.1 pyruvate, phosphate dikinase [Chloroflexota bacterium]